MRKVLIGAVLLLLAVAGLGTACGFREQPGDPQAMTIKNYDAPQGYSARDIHRIVGTVLGHGEGSVGRATTGPGGTIIVTAPESVHRGIGELLAKLEAQGTRPVEPEASVTLNYWFLVARPRPDGGLSVASPALAKNAALRPVMEQIVGSQGGMEFHLLEQMRLTTIESEDGSVRGRFVEIRQRLMRYESGQRVADIRLTMFGSQGVRHTLETRVKLESGRFVVLGETAFKAQGSEFAALREERDELMLYYVISSSID